MPPPGARQQADGDEEEQEPVGRFAGFEHQDEQNNCDQTGAASLQVVPVEVAEKLFDFIEVHNVLRSMSQLSGSVPVQRDFDGEFAGRLPDGRGPRGSQPNRVIGCARVD